jgi:hypothetical protein
MMTLRLLLVSALFLVFGSSSANAFTITFDDIDATTPVGIPTGYLNADWNNLHVLNGADFPVESGFRNGVVSKNNVAYTTSGASIIAPTPFTLVSAYFTAAWSDGVYVTVRGLLGNEQKYTQTFTVDTTGSTFIELNMSNIDRVTIAPAGGTPHYEFYTGAAIAIDNIEISEVPVPAALPLFGTALVSLVGVARRRRA